MPRRTRRDDSPALRRRGRGPGPPAEVAEIAARIAGPSWAAAEVDGYQVKATTGIKRYRCPYCNGWIEPGTSHIVAFVVGLPEERRHYHSGCWVRFSAGRR